MRRREGESRRSAGRAAIVIAIVLTSCGAELPIVDAGAVDGGGVDDAGGADHRSDADDAAGGDAEAVECYDAIDIVFVLDVSSSMAVLIRALEAQLGSVWAMATEHDREARFGLVVFVDDVLVDNSGEPFDSIDALRERLRVWADHTGTNQQIGTDAPNTDWPENTLDALCAAAREFAWRDEETTLRVVIHATDDSFLEHPYAFSSAVQVQHTYAEAVELLRQRSIRVASFAAHDGGPSDGLDVSPGFFADYGDSAPIPAATSGLAFEITEVGRSVALSDAIVDFVEGELCEEYVVY